LRELVEDRREWEMGRVGRKREREERMRNGESWYIYRERRE
jgi:hypothetical protein